MTKVTNISGIFLVIHILFWALHYQDYWNSLTFFFVIAQIWHISILMISYPHYLNYSFLSFLELKKCHLSYQITQITKIVNLFQEQNDKIVTIVTNIIHRIFSVWKKLAHIEPCLKLQGFTFANINDLLTFLGYSVVFLLLLLFLICCYF